MCLSSAASEAVSLLRHLWHELLGRRDPVRDIPRFLGYVLELSTDKLALTVSDYDTATGIAIIYAETLPYSGVLNLNWGDAYCSIALSLNVLLTLMLITRLVLHSKDIRCVMGYQDGASGLYKATITTLVESGALYAASFVLLVGPWASGSVAQYITFQITSEIQVRTVFTLP